MALTFLIGGARSGKSRLAVDVGRSFEQDGGRVRFVATSARPDDPDWAARVERHRSERPPWPTHEAPHDVTAAVEQSGADELVIVDCLTLWVSNLLERGDAADDVVAAAAQLADAAARRVAPTVVVSNEVGLGIHPATPLGRHFRDLLGAVNRCVAAGANTAWLVVAGRVVRLESVAAADVVG